MNLNDINSPSDIKSLSIDELTLLASDMRKALLEKLSKHGGHVGPNLGFIEPTIALHYVFDSPKDKIVFDVSHQCYAHKMLTGRMKAFTDPDYYDSVSGFTNPQESRHDFFTIGHTSTGTSLAGGLAKARDLAGGNENIIAVVGDGSLSGGEAFEGLDFAATLNSNLIIVVNDNDMSIAENHGGLYGNLRKLRETNGTAPCNYFKSLGLDYRYVAYGNDLKSLIDAFSSAKDTDHPIVIHLNTMKGEGYAPAEADKERFHFSAPFDLPTGDPLSFDEEPDYTDIFAEKMLEFISEDPSAAVITAGTPGAIGFTPDRRKRAGKQFIDVGIAEQEAVSLASGMAKGGARPCLGVVSSFIQRAYDQLSQDIAINNTPAVINVFFGSVYAMNDVTHLGWFDISLISNIPNLIFLAPTCRNEYISMLTWAMKQTHHPIVIKVPPGNATDLGNKYPSDYSDINKFMVDKVGSDVAIIAAGDFYKIGEEVSKILNAASISPTLINPRFLSGIDEATLNSLKQSHSVVVTLEDGIIDGGFGEKISAYYGTTGNIKVKNYGLRKEFLDRYNAAQLLKELGLEPQSIANDIIELLK